MARTSRFSPEVRDRAVRMVLEHLNEYESTWAGIKSIAPPAPPCWKNTETTSITRSSSGGVKEIDWLLVWKSGTRSALVKNSTTP